MFLWRLTSGGTKYLMGGDATILLGQATAKTGEFLAITGEVVLALEGDSDPRLLLASYDVQKLEA